MTKEIFNRYFNGDLSAIEERELLNWIDASDANRREFFQERKLWDMLLLNSPETMALSAPNLTVGKTDKTHSRKKWILEFSKIAAVFIIAICIGGWLTLKYSEEPQAWNTIEVPIGQRACLHLADGTRVWLNAKSRFTFPDKFKKGLREVKLDGEAVFDVVHNEKSTFVVKTKRFNVRVLGTKFNIYAYDNSSVFETALVRGKVMLEKRASMEKPIELKPNQMGVYHDETGTIEIKTIDTKESLYWTEGVYSFNNQPLSCIIQRLERYYEVSISVKHPDILNYKFTGKFRYSDPIDIILEVIKKSKFFKYTKKDNQITIYK